MTFKRLLFFSLCLLSLNITKAQITKVQFINNCADVNFPGIDIYVDGQLLQDDLFFRSSTPYIDISTINAVSIGIAPMTSTSATDTFFNLNIQLSSSDQYAIIANGIESTTGYNPSIPFRLSVTNKAREAQPGPNSADILFANGCTEMNQIDFRTGITTMANDVGFGTFNNDYFSFNSTQVYNIRLTNASGSKITHNFEADFTGLGMDDFSGVAVTSGFLNPANNSNGEGFGLWVAPSTGGNMIQIPTTTSREFLSRMQLINNSADTGVGKIDIYINSNKVADTLNFRYATPYFDVFANAITKIDVVKEGQPLASSFYDTTFVLDSGKVYSSVLIGIKSDTNYTPRPPFKLKMSGNAIEDASDPTKVDVLFLHGATDFTYSDVNLGSNVIVNNITYDAFTNNLTSLSATNQVLDVDTNNGNIYSSYSANFQTWNAAGKGGVILYSGFMYPDSNSQGPNVGLWAAFPEGGKLTELPVYVSVNEITAAKTVHIYPNPANNTISINGVDNYSEVHIYDNTGRLVQTSILTNNKININRLASGMYTLQIVTDKNTLYSKFIKN